MVGFPRTLTLLVWLLEVGGTAGEHSGPVGETDVAVTVQLLPLAGVDRTARLVGVGPGGGDGASGAARADDGKLSGGVTSASCSPFGLEADTAVSGGLLAEQAPASDRPEIAGEVVPGFTAVDTVVTGSVAADVIAVGTIRSAVATGGPGIVGDSSIASCRRRDDCDAADGRLASALEVGTGSSSDVED